MPTSEARPEALMEAISGFSERAVAALLPALDESSPGPRQRAVALAKGDLDALLPDIEAEEAGSLREGARFLSSFLADIAEGRRPADEAHVDLCLRCLGAVSSLVPTAGRENTADGAARFGVLKDEAAELARAFFDDEDLDPDEDAELAAIFVEEARCHLERATDALRLLRASPGDQEALRALFRAMHTIKGGAATVGEQALTEHSHAMEDILSAAIKGEIGLDGDLLDLIDESLDETASLVSRLGLGKESAAPLAVSEPVIVHAAKPREQPDSPRTIRVGIDRLESLLFDAAELGSLRNKASVAAARLRSLAGRARSRRRDLAGGVDAFISDHLNPLARRAFRSEEELEKESRREARSAMARAEEIAEIDRDLASIMETIFWLSADIAEDMEQVGSLSARMKAAATEMRFVPIAGILERYALPAAEWAERTGRAVEIRIEAEDVHVDRGVAESLGEPLVQLVRNAIAHGIEEPEERVRAGKPRAGRVVLRAQEEGADLVLEVEDDGRGMDPSELRDAAVAKGLLSREEAQAMPDLRLPELALLPGFSTKPEADLLGGRGVGLDIVATTVSRLGGIITVSSEHRRGTRFSARMTPSASTLPVIDLRCGGHKLALPLAAVRETMLIEKSEIEEGRHEWRGAMLPTLRLADVVECRAGDDPGIPSAIVFGHGDRHAVLLVSSLLGREEGMLRPLGRILDPIPLYSGAVVGSDGEIRLVLDASHLLYIALGLRPKARDYSLSK